MFYVLLSGGSGVRLWPLSNATRSKQYLKILKDNSGNDISIAQRVSSQLECAGINKDNLMIVANKAQTGILRNQLGNEISLIEEPSRRDTFSAVLLACAYTLSEKDAKDDDFIVFMPVDPYVDNGYFECMLSLGEVLNSTKADLVLMAVTPTEPNENFGYIIPEKQTEKEFSNVLRVKEFKEKPDVETAKKIINEGALWNCGVFCFKISFYKQIIKEYSILPDYVSVYKNLSKFPAISFDYAVVEKCKNIYMVKYDGMWKDLGSWNSITGEMSINSVGNNVIDEKCENIHVINELNIPTVVMGVSDSIIVVASDGVLVSSKTRSHLLKNYIQDVNIRPMYEERRWGNIRIIDCLEADGKIYLTAKIKLNAGMDFSYHRHNKHDETYVIFEGEGKLIVDGMVSTISPGESFIIKKGQKHSLHAIKDILLIEIQSGECSADEDKEEITLNWSEIRIIS